MNSKPKDQPEKRTHKKPRDGKSKWKLILKQRNHRSRQLAGFKTIWR